MFETDDDEDVNCHLSDTSTELDSDHLEEMKHDGGNET